MRLILVRSLKYDFSTCEVPFRYIIKSISVHFKRNFAARLERYAAGLQMLNGCLACYVQHAYRNTQWTK